MPNKFERFLPGIATLLAIVSILFVMFFTILARPAHATDTPPPPETVDKVLSFIEQGATSFAGTVQNVVAQYGQPAYELAKATARVAAINDLLPGVVLAFICAPLIWFCRKGYAKTADNTDRYSDKEGWAILMVTSGIGALGTFVAALVNLANAWAWVGLFHPEIYMVKMAIEVLK